MSPTALPSLPAGSARPLPSARRIVVALLLGALCGAGTMAVSALAVTAAQGSAIYGLVLAGLILTFGFVGWLVGLVLIGGPTWWLARKAKASPTRLAAGLGAILTPLFLAGPFIVEDLIHGDLHLPPIAMAAVYAPFGALVGWVVARIAYGPAR